MRFVIFGLTVSSSWGNGHATLWRGLIQGLAARGHRVCFFERDVPWYADHRDVKELPGGVLRLYRDWREALPLATRELADADVAIVTSYCPDALDATALVLGSDVDRKVFYDLDTPVTMERLAAGEPVSWIGPEGLGGFDLVLSFTGGPALDELERRAGARRTAPLYGSVDPRVHRPLPPRPEFSADFSYMGTWAADRQSALESFFLEPARRLPERKFLLGGALYPADFPWRENIYYMQHVAPCDHPAFFCSSPLTLNITRGAMAAMGYCPSGRLFEAAACGTAMLSDWWPGLDEFFEPGRELLVARTSEDAVNAISMDARELGRMARAAQERVLAEHTADRRAADLLELVESVDEPARRQRPASGERGDEHVGHRSGSGDW